MSRVPPKDQLNAALARVTGHHLAKGAPGEHLADLRRELRQVRAELARRSKRKGDGFPKASTPRPKTSSGPSGPTP